MKKKFFPFIASIRLNEGRFGRIFMNIGNKSYGSDGYNYRHYGAVTIRNDGAFYWRNKSKKH